MNNLFSGIYKNKRVLVTGHTGFKGSWLASWLDKLSAKVLGYSLESPSNPNHIDLLDLNIENKLADIRDLETFKKVVKEFRPEIIFHLAAQSLVRESYSNPLETYDVNVMGTMKIFEACRDLGSLKAIINITSDKCYENIETNESYVETDPMGGYDPYSSSKGCSELLTNSFRNSFFNINQYGKDHRVLIASARAGNVIGGGDWAKDRIVPDIMRAMEKNEKVKVRNPNAIRPWQYVLEPLSGYLLLGQKLLEGEKEFSGAWNFGPDEADVIPVKSLVESFRENWSRVDFELAEDPSAPHEAALLKLNCTKAMKLLAWRGTYNSNDTFLRTISWYKEYYDNKKIITSDDIYAYINEAKNKDIEWAKS